MKKLKSSGAVKALAVILLMVMTVMILYSAIGVGFMYSYGAYSGASKEFILKSYLEPWCERRLYDVMEGFRYGQDMKEMDSYLPGMTFNIYDENWELVYQGLEDQEYLLETSPFGFWYTEDAAESFDPGTGAGADYYAEPSATPEPAAEPDAAETPAVTGAEEEPAESPSAPTAEPEESPATATARPEETAPAAPGAPQNGDGQGSMSDLPMKTDNTVTIYMDAESQEKRYKAVGYVLEDESGDSYSLLMRGLVELCYDNRIMLLQVLCLAIVLFTLLFIFLMSAAGHRKGCTEIQAGLTEKIPFDIHTVAVTVAGCMLMVFFAEVSYGDVSLVKLAAYGVITGAAALLCTWWCMSLAVRIKLGTVLRGCICYRMLSWCWDVLKKCWGILRESVNGLRLIPKAALIIFGILLLEFCWISGFNWNVGMLMTGWFVERLVLVGLTVYTLLCMMKLLQAGKEISGGNMDYRVDTAKMYGPLREHGRQLNQITEGMTKAVNERMKSEHFRTELITNVSHDIKTPLTSIINYVDLLEKEDIENEKAREYLEVLARQSARLKKLIDDLMEASKASTGNITVNLERCQLEVLIDQCTGEYAEKLKNAGLELVVTRPEAPVVIMADGRHMWRIFDNLLNNICKYAMAGTRVYLNLDRAEGKAVVTFRNISSQQLNISGEELMERFVRGDASRNTEGSGLGLSIARSLVQLQGGSLEMTVDGDLFKVTLKFNIAQ